MAIPDRWNPRIWLRDWLSKPSEKEKASRSYLVNLFVDGTLSIDEVRSLESSPPDSNCPRSP